ncbi:somatomedin-B and thrombospondin type-1 domain-containing protein isoform X3 [Pseudoliparis swirei]|uniref:somatomedin-B and thrombospondin type-1 domain-containing protein isoform X3 n=1 Tax=Pseudoliparis swirei TaxID=2059687 RepID=UPI0024BED93B|nr:somatomedin-B and thrombospondin type-1 domain-containing protein isoform X3 [Pseudoliparis swirei]
MGARGWSSARLGWLVVGGCVALFCFPRAEAGCGERQSPNCCTGRDNDCFEYSKRKTACYCDTYCQKTGDCCEDYRRVCQISAAIDCVAGSWGPWSPCTSPCGVGSTERSRQVSVPPRNGGAPCPDLKQRRGCFGNNAICGTAKASYCQKRAPSPAASSQTLLLLLFAVDSLRSQEHQTITLSGKDPAGFFQEELQGPLEATTHADEGGEGQLLCVPAVEAGQRGL